MQISVEASRDGGQIVIDFLPEATHVVLQSDMALGLAILLLRKSADCVERKSFPIEAGMLELAAAALARLRGERQN